MTDYAYGVYILQSWASVGGGDAATVTQNFLAKYGKDAISAIGNVFNTQQLNVVSVKSEFQKLLDAGSDINSPSESDINQAILNVAGTPPSFGKIVEQGVGDTVKQAETVGAAALTGLKWVAVVAVVAGLVFVAYELGWLREIKSKLQR